MRVIQSLIALAFVLLGASVGALNQQPVTIDFAFASVETTLGVALLVALLVGVLIGGVATAARSVSLTRARMQPGDNLVS